eukprot:CAMPEP_0168318978 /NCGR_PEP_ID=MMETSP0213-20121227/789_1 /TAXON_ID=151035 /ORGANISM="Euplotes harpa, Strain FSP1.4" /LENGTH=236 /DNA_ID=CAMNT_0008320125 /DNA_START=696 /DNA_END=1406 /DNA_ORIENTATION=+
MKVLSCSFLNKYNKAHEAYIEKHALASCKHPNVVKFHKCFTAESSLCFILELCEKGTLADFLKQNLSVSEDAIRYIAANILNGLEYIHKNQIVHRDLKPSNLLIDDNGKVKITDFGTAKIFNCSSDQVNKAIHKRNKREESRSISPTKKNSFVGTHEYVSPEILKNHEPSYAIDLWGLGVILYEMYTGRTPFASDHEMETYDNICSGKLKRPFKIPKIAWDLIKRLLQVNPSDRIG